MNNCQYTPITLLAILILLLPANSFGESFSSKVHEGVSNYEKQRYEKASQLFQDAYTQQPDNSQLAYNLANSDYKSGKFDKSLGAYAKAMAADPKLRQGALYNSGNALFRMGKLEDAAAAYKKSLELNPKDLDAKFNLEFVREEIKKQQQKQDNQNTDKQQNQDKQNQESNKQQNTGQDQQPKDSDQDKRQQEAKDKKDRDQPNKNQQAQNKPSEKKSGQSIQSDMKKSEMTKEEADQWLRSLVENPKKFTQKQIQEQLKQAKESVGNDW